MRYIPDKEQRVCVCVRGEERRGDAQEDYSGGTDCILEAREGSRKGEVEDGELVDDGQQAAYVCACCDEGKAARESKVGVSFECYSEREVSPYRARTRTWR